MAKKRIVLYAAGFILAVILIYLPGFSELQRLKELNAQHERRIKLLEEQNKGLEEEIKKMRTNPDYVEEKAREKLGIIKKGEVVYKKK